ncbi:uncharacterized protein LOC125502364 isoform X1 [Dendroctonus ponderosae]|uniref:uncharacterized protein LOC125502364 isoform X1 n=1 Tax=Dendroctonus ponderosae TaxID=77166 RepID=UPI002036651E|nr:uncharacterized protein LOC125502364 isoform X1 [Dendroctonus ponderosae]
MANKTHEELQQLLLYCKRNRGSVTAIATRLGTLLPDAATPQWLLLTNKTLLPQPDVVAFPKPPKAPDGSLMYERVPNKPDADKIPVNNMSPSLKRRAYEEMNGIDNFYSDLDWDEGSCLNAPPAKRMSKEPMPISRHPVASSALPGTGPLAGNTALSSNADQYQMMMAAAVQAHTPAGLSGPMPRQVAQVNGKPKIAQMTRSGSGRKQVISWMDAPDDLYFKATEHSKKIRRQISSVELRRAARKPWRYFKTRLDEPPVVVLD